MIKNFSCILVKKDVKILIIQTAFIGDVILTTPLFSTIKRHNSSAILHALVTPKTANILENNPHIARIVTFDKNGKDTGLKGLGRVGNRLRRENYDVVFSPHKSIRSAVLAVQTKASVRVGFNDSSIPVFFNVKSVYDKKKHEVERNLSLLQKFNVNVQPDHPSVFPGQADKRLVREYMVSNGLGRPFVTIAPGSVWATKRWPVDAYKVLAKLLTKSTKVVLLGGKQDFSICEQVKNNNPAITNTAGQFSLLQSAEIINRSSVLISNDSAPMHLASAVTTPVIAIFGPTVPEFGYAPYGEGNLVIEKQFECRPCRRHGSARCPIGTHDCMKQIKAEYVFQRTKRFIEFEQNDE